MRRRQGLTQAEVARRAGTSQPVVSAYEHGRRDPTFGTLRKLVEASGERLELDASRGDERPAAAARPRRARPPAARRAVGRRRHPRAPPRPGAARAPARLVVTRRSLAERIVAIDGALAAIPHAFGGALALAYYAEPRATIDIDLNVFVTADRFAEVAAPLAALGVAIDVPEVAARGAARRPGARVLGRDPTRPVLRLRRVPRRRRPRPARASRSPTGRSRSSAPSTSSCARPCSTGPRDWVDIDAMVAADAVLDAAEVLRWVGRIAGDEDPRYGRIAAVLTRR